MTKEQVAHIRQTNNNIEVRYMFESEEKSTESSKEFPIPNPIETFEQAFEVSIKYAWIKIYHKMYPFNWKITH